MRKHWIYKLTDDNLSLKGYELLAPQELLNNFLIILELDNNKWRNIAFDINIINTLYNQLKCLNNPHYNKLFKNNKLFKTFNLFPETLCFLIQNKDSSYVQEIIKKLKTIKDTLKNFHIEIIESGENYLNYIDEIKKFSQSMGVEILLDDTINIMNKNNNLNDFLININDTNFIKYIKLDKDFTHFLLQYPEELRNFFYKISGIKKNIIFEGIETINNLITLTINKKIVEKETNKKIITYVQWFFLERPTLISECKTCPTYLQKINKELINILTKQNNIYQVYQLINWNDLPLQQKEEQEKKYE